MVHPSMEYAAAVWDPHHVGCVQELEKVQQKLRDGHVLIQFCYINAGTLRMGHSKIKTNYNKTTNII